MNEYKWGTMMNDYVLLEEMGRKVGDWGNDIARGGFETRGAARGGRGGHAPRNHNKAPKTKRDILKMELEAQDITMDLLPMGMERRKLNQSIWDFKCVLYHAQRMTVLLSRRVDPRLRFLQLNLFSIHHCPSKLHRLPF